MRKWYMSRNGRATVTDAMAQDTLANLRRLKHVRLVVCGLCWKERK